MKLAQKTFLYSILLSAIIVTMFVCYFALLFPSLYIEHIQRDNYERAVALQKQYLKDRSYENIEVKNPTGTLTADIPFSGNKIMIANNFMKGSITVTDADFLHVMEQFRSNMKNPEELGDGNTQTWFDVSLITNKLKTYEDSLASLPFSIKWESSGFTPDEWSTDVDFHLIEDNFYVMEAEVTQGETRYSTYLAVTVTENNIVLTFTSVAAPHMKDVMPVVIGSMPMIIVVIILLVLLLSQIFSKWIIIPIIRLSKHAENVRRVGNKEVLPITLKGNDEITSLGKNLNELYAKLRDSYKELEDNNKILSIENERQEVFLRSFSHQLKTPVSAALLLVQGMQEEIGKYKDTKLYLPKVKEQLISIQKIVEDIIYLNHCLDNAKTEEISIDTLVRSCVSNLEIPIAEKSLKLEITGNGETVSTSADVLKIIVDNLLSNAVFHTKEEEKIHIIHSSRQLRIINEGSCIPENILPHIFEPFVTNTDGHKGHGLGLYIVKYYAQYLNYEVTVKNTEKGVEADLYFI